MREENDCPLGASIRRTVRETGWFATEQGQGPYLVRQRTRPSTIYVARGIHEWVLWPILLRLVPRDRGASGQSSQTMALPLPSIVE
jgi:hypothetical protein